MVRKSRFFSFNFTRLRLARAYGSFLIEEGRWTLLPGLFLFFVGSMTKRDGIELGGAAWDGRETGTDARGGAIAEEERRGTLSGTRPFDRSEEELE
jgi:hypothetical protein